MISSNEKNHLRDGLLAADTVTPALQAEYERNVNAMFETQLSITRKLWFVGLILFNVIAAGIVVWLVSTESLPRRASLALLTGVGFAIAWSVYFIQLLRRGTFRRRVDAPLAAGMAFGFSLIMCIVLAIGGLSTDKVILAAMFSLMPAGLIVLRTVIEQSELRTQERLVELQYRLALLTEKLTDDDGTAGAGVRR